MKVLTFKLSGMPPARHAADILFSWYSWVKSFVACPLERFVRRLIRREAQMKQETKGYKQREDGSFRLRASFPMNKELILKANAVCERDGISMYALCRQAVERYVDDRLAGAALTQ